MTWTQWTQPPVITRIGVKHYARARERVITGGCVHCVHAVPGLTLAAHGSSRSRMAFTEVRCSRCRHVGFAYAAALPAMLCCSRCTHVELFRNGCKTIRAHCVKDDADACG